MYCYKCGKQLPENSPFCAFCGAGQGTDAAANNISSAPDKPEASRKSRTPSIRGRRFSLMLAILLLIIAALIVFILLPIMRGEEIFNGILPLNTTASRNDDTATKMPESSTIIAAANISSSPVPVHISDESAAPVLAAPAAPPAPVVTPILTPAPTPAPSPTPSPTPAPRFFSDVGLDNFLLEGGSRYYEYAEVTKLNAYELSIVRNGLYAMSGLQFLTNQTLIDYFNACRWYYPDTTSAETAKSRFNQYQNVNLELITDVEREKGLRK